MPSLRDVLRAHAPLLVIDAASARVQVGLVAPDGSARWQGSEDESGVAVFTCVRQLGVRLEDIAAFAFCEGPGSILGIRTVAMALRTWNVLNPRPVFAYSSLALVAHDLAPADVRVIADARRDSWHVYQAGHGLKRLPTADLRDATGLVTPEGFRNWSALPPGTTRVPYDVAALWSRAADVDLLHPTEAPDAFLHEEPSYVTWTPQIHRAPTR